MLCGIIASLQGKKGRLAVPGLYKDVARRVAVKIAARSKDFSSKFPTISVSKST